MVYNKSIVEDTISLSKMPFLGKLKVHFEFGFQAQSLNLIQT